MDLSKLAITSFILFFLCFELTYFITRPISKSSHTSVRTPQYYHLPIALLKCFITSAANYIFLAVKLARAVAAVVVKTVFCRRLLACATILNTDQHIF